MRLAASLALLLLQGASGLLPHRHGSNLAENIWREEATVPVEVHEIGCRNPTSSHWHRDRVVEVEPCLACLRQHLVGIELHAPVRPILTIVQAAGPIPSRMPVPGFRFEPSSRGPPTLL